MSLQTAIKIVEEHKSQKWLASKIDVTPRAVRYWKTKTYKPTPEHYRSVMSLADQFKKKLWRIWIKIDYKSKRAGHDIKIRGWLQRHVVDPDRLAGEVYSFLERQVLNSELVAMMEYGAEPQGKGWANWKKGRLKTKTKAEERTAGSERGILHINSRTYKFRYQNGWRKA